MSFIAKNEKVFVAGHLGLVGSAVTKVLHEKKYNVLTRTRAELDLLDQGKVEDFFRKEKPKTVIIAAARVGGINANNTYRSEFIYENLQIQNNVVWSAYKNDVDRLVLLGSSCIYPKHAKQPIAETELLTGPLEYTNRPYAIAKIAGVELVNSLKIQYKKNYFSVMPTNLYGLNDNFDVETSHVLPALVRKFCEAVRFGHDSVEVWGSGKPKREFMYVDDCAEAIVFLAENFDFENYPETKENWSHINIGYGEDISIKDLSHLIAEVSGYKGKIIFKTDMPDGTPKKLMDSSILKGLGWKPKINLNEGVERVVAEYRKRFLG